MFIQPITANLIFLSWIKIEPVSTKENQEAQLQQRKKGLILTRGSAARPDPPKRPAEVVDSGSRLAGRRLPLPVHSQDWKKGKRAGQ